MTGVQLAGPGDEALEPLVAKVEAISVRLGSWLADPAGEAPPELAEQLRSMQAIEQLAAEQLSDGVPSHLHPVLETALRAVILAMTQRQQHHGRLSKVASEELKQCSLQVTACSDRILKGLVAAPWAEGTSVQMAGESGHAIGRLVHTLVRLVAIGCEPSLWAPLQNTAWAKLNALREAGALGLGNPHGKELRQIIGAELIKRIGDRQRSISELAATAGGQINASADGIERQAKVLRFFATKGAGLVPSDPIEFVETLCGIVAEMLFVAWHQPKADEGPSDLSMAVTALLEMLVSLGAELPTDTHGVQVLSALASWFTAAFSERVQTLGVLLCLVRLLPLMSNWASVQQVAAAQPLMQLARTAMHQLCKLAQVKHTDAFGAVLEDACQSLAQWVASVPLSIQSQLQLFLLEMVLAPGNGGACPEMAVVTVTVWETALRNMEDARILHAHAQTLINLTAGTGVLLPSLRAVTRGLLGTICGRLSAEAGRAADDQAAAALVDGSVDTFQILLGSLAETVRSAGPGAGVELVLPALLQPPSTRALRLLQDATSQTSSQTQHGQQVKQLVHLGKALSAAAISVSADAAPFSGAQGEADLKVLLNALKVLVQSTQTTGMTPNALGGAAVLLRVATRLEFASRPPEGRHMQSSQRPVEQVAAARRLRNACCDVLRAAMGPPAAASSIPLLTKLLALEALADGVTALDSAAAAKSSPILSLFRQCLASVQTAVKAVPLHVATARGWRYEVSPTYPTHFKMHLLLRFGDCLAWI
jgi:hypothetical protein